jgi:hypothetical protein
MVRTWTMETMPVEDGLACIPIVAAMEFLKQCSRNLHIAHGSQCSLAPVEHIHSMGSAVIITTLTLRHTHARQNYACFAGPGKVQ